MSNRTIPLKRRPLDIAILGFFVVNLLFITYVVDFEQLIIPDPVVHGQRLDKLRAAGALIWAPPSERPAVV